MNRQPGFASRARKESLRTFTSRASSLYSFPVIPRLLAVFIAACLIPAMPPTSDAAAAARPVTTRVPTLAVDQVKSGQKAIVRTVFEGSRIEEFEAVIVGVLHNGRADGDLILGRATSERVKLTGIAQGMSGSPVYIDGKLIGARPARPRQVPCDAT